MTNNPILQDLLLLAAVSAVGIAPLFLDSITDAFQGFLLDVNRRKESLRLMLRHEASSPWYLPTY